MPVKLMPYGRGLSDVPRGGYKYNYPHGLDLKPGSEMHTKLKDLAFRMASESWSFMSHRYDAWSAIDESLTSYVVTDDYEKAVQDKDTRKPVSIVVPISFATIEILLTYMVATFLGNTIFRYDGTGPEDIPGSILLQHIIGKQSKRFKHGLDLYAAWRDGLAYGIGAVTPVWTKKYGFRSRRIDGRDGPRNRITLYEGNKLEAIDPYRFYPDPSVPVHRIQDGEFVGWVVETTRHSLLGQEHANPDEFFNVKYLEHMDARSSLIMSDPTGRNIRTGVDEPHRAVSGGMTNPVHVLNMFINLIPSQYGLGDSDYPEKWLISLAGDEIILRAGPARLDHDMYPVGVCTPNFDGHTLTPISHLEISAGMQTVINFLFNSHIANVRKALNDMFVVDPKLINMFDFEQDKKEGMIIRLREAAWGLGLVDKAIKQLTVQDITANNISDIAWLMDVKSRTIGDVDMLQGIMRSGGERRSATEAEHTRAGAVSRLAKMARLVGMQLMQDLAYMIASQTSQMMSEETYVKVVGDMEQQILSEYNIESGRVSVRPEDLEIDYDVSEYDGSLPGELADSQSWVQLFQTIGSSEALLQEFDIVRIFSHIARGLGAKEMESFRRVVAETRTNGEIERGIQSGELASLDQMVGALRE